MARKTLNATKGFMVPQIASQDSELVEIVDHILATVRESVLSRPFHARTVPEMWRAAEAAAESAESNAEAALAMLRTRALLTSHWRMRRGIS